jgi:glycosyltransferase involved in cell wall biosynthesis
MGTIRGLLVGDGLLFDEVKAQIARLGLSERVRLTGYRSDVRQLVQCLDLFVLCSWSEGTSIALLEAMATGVAVAVTEAGGNTEIVTRGATGWSVPCGAVEGLTAVILEAARNPAQRERLAQAGEARFRERFSWPRMMAAYRERYAELLTKQI